MTEFLASCVQGSICFEMAKGIPAAIVALIIGLIAAGITYRQYRVARAKLALDLFEKRLKVFQEVTAFLKLSLNGVAVTEYPAVLYTFDDEAKFLFGSEISGYITYCTGQAGAFRTTQANLLDKEYVAFVGEEKRHEEYLYSIELRDWLAAEIFRGGCEAKFSPYLDFSRWK